MEGEGRFKLKDAEVGLIRKYGWGKNKRKVVQKKKLTDASCDSNINDVV